MEPKANDAEVAAVLPEEIQKKLRALIRRAKRVILFRGVMAVVTVLLVSVLGVMAIDASFTIFSGWIRWVLSLSALALTVWTAIRFLIKPLRRKISLAAVARAVEAQHPEMEERVSTAVELLSGESKFDRGSEQLLKKVVEFAVKDVGDVTPETEFTTRSARKFKWAAVAALGVLLVAFGVWPKQVGLLFARALAPFAEIGNAYSGKIQSITGDLTVAKGEPVTLEVVIEDPGVRKADLRTVIAGAEVEAIERMEREGDGGEGTRRFVFRIPAVAESFDYRVHCGKILSSTHTVVALDRPAVSKLEITYRYPEYTGLGVETLAEDAREILAPVGTEVSLRAGLNREVERMALTVNGEELPAPEMDELYGQPVAVWKFVLTPGMNSVWRIDLKDEHEIDGSEGEYAVQAVADEKPTVTMLTPEEREIRVRPTETVPMTYSATEDYGFSAIEVLVKKEPGGQEVVAQVLPVRAADDRRAWDGRAVLSLAKLNLEGAQRLRARLRVKDTLPVDLGGANEALSEELVIVLDRGAQTLFEQTVAAEAEDFKKEIWETMSELREARWRAENSAKQMKNEEAMRPETLQRLQETQEKAQSATERLETLADKMEDSAFARNAEPMREIASDHTEPAAETAAEIPLSDDREERVAEAQSIVEEIDAALKDLDETIRAIDEARPEMAEAARLDQMAQQQQQLATQAAETQPEPASPSEAAEAGSPPATQEQAAMTPQEQQQWQQQQQQLANEIEAMAEQQEQQADRNAGLQEQSEQAQELAQEASQLAQAEEELSNLIDDSAREANEDAVREQLLAALQQEQESITAEAEAMQEGAAPSGASEQAQEAVSEAAESAGDALAGLEEAVQEGGESADDSVAEAAQAAQASAEKLAAAAGSEGLPESSAEAEAAMSEVAAEASGSEAAEGAPAGAAEEGAAGDDTGAAEESRGEGEPAGAEEGGETPGEAAAGQEAGGETGGEPSAEETGSEGGEGGEAGEGAEEGGTEAMAASQQGLEALAERQAQVADVLSALDEGGIEAALGEMQGQLAEQGEALAEATGALQQQVQQNQAPSQAMTQALNDAASELTEGSQQAGEASEALGEAAAAEGGAGEVGESGEAPAAGDAPEGSFAEAGQQAAGQAAAQAAQESFAEAAQSLAMAAEGLAAQAQGQMGQGEALQAAAEAASEAAQSAQPGQPGEGNQPSESGQMGEAAQSAQEAANALAAAAQSAMQSMGVPQGFMPGSALAANQPPGQGQPGQPGQQPGQQPGKPGQPPGAPAPGEGGEPNQEGAQANQAYSDIPPGLAKLGVSIEDWMRIKGTAQSAVGGGQSAQVPAEYRELVKGYFEALSKGGGE